MNKYMSVSVTICEGSAIQGGHLYYSDEELGLEISTNLSYNEGMKLLRQLEQRLGKSAELKTNIFDPAISYKEIHGYLNRE